MALLRSSRTTFCKSYVGSSKEVAPHVHGDAANAGDEAQDRADFRLYGRGKCNIFLVLRVELASCQLSGTSNFRKFDYPSCTGLPYKRMLIAVIVRAGRRPV
jgi:hypothetical protein